MRCELIADFARSSYGVRLQCALQLRWIDLKELPYSFAVDRVRLDHRRRNPSVRDEREPFDHLFARLYNVFSGIQFVVNATERERVIESHNSACRSLVQAISPEVGISAGQRTDC